MTLASLFIRDVTLVLLTGDSNIIQRSGVTGTDADTTCIANMLT